MLFQSRIHPAQPANTIPEDKLILLHTKIISICCFVAKVEGNTQAFPRDWLMLYRWGKARSGKKGGTKQKTAEGYTVDHVTVGGRTSTFVPELQKLSGSTSRPSKRKAEGTASATTTTKSKKAKAITKSEPAEPKSEPGSEVEDKSSELEKPIKRTRKRQPASALFKKTEEAKDKSELLKSELRGEESDGGDNYSGETVKPAAAANKRVKVTKESRVPKAAAEAKTKGNKVKVATSISVSSTRKTRASTRAAKKDGI